MVHVIRNYKIISVFHLFHVPNMCACDMHVFQDCFEQMDTTSGHFTKCSFLISLFFDRAPVFHVTSWDEV
jgi:hypothetical protein